MDKASNLRKAQKAKNDEFYTRSTDIEKELRYYKEYFKGKVVYMNADDPEWSNFWKYFKLSFKHLGLKKIISTHYSYDETQSTYKLEYDGSEVIKTELKSNGDFRNEESIEILKEADIVVTNPPFSLWVEYIEQLIKYKKKFIIIGNFNAVTFKNVFPLILEEKLWVGMSPRSMEFETPEGDLKSVNAVWFTNLEVPRRLERLRLYKEYNEKEYPKYDNYDAIEVSRVSDIPKDYEGIMGVPITFLDKHNPKQFRLVGIAAGHTKNTMSNEVKEYVKFNPNMKSDQGTYCYAILDGKQKYHRLLIEKV